MHCEIAKDVFWVGAVDWNARHFHGHTFNTSAGTTYNSYLIIDDKIALIDAVFGPFAGELLDNISGIVPPEKIDYVVANHVETDHSGALPEVMRAAPRAGLFGTAKCRDGLSRHYYADWPFRTVKTGDKLPLGRRTLSFIEAPMLHWPDSMFTYLDREKILFSNDAFGQHLAHSRRFADEAEQGLLMRETAKYYANILWPLSRLVQNKITELRESGLPVSMIAPSHGMIWRRDDPGSVMANYARWARNSAVPRAVIVYESMWGGTEKMAGAVYDGLAASGAEAEVFDINRADRSEIIGRMLEAGGYLFGSSTHDNAMLPNLAGFLHLLKGLRPQGRLSAVFGSFGWAGGAVKEIEKILTETGIPPVYEGLSVQYNPSPADLEACRELGREFGRRLLESYR